MVLLLGTIGLLHEVAGLRGLVLLGGFVGIVLLVRSWVRGRRLARARTLEHLRDLTPGEFETVSQRLFQRMGFAMERVGGAGDGGVDLAGRSADGAVLVQCKRYRGVVGSPQVRDFYGALSKAQAASGYIVTTGGFTEAARRWALDVPIPLTLVDGTTLVGLVRAYLAPDVLPYHERTGVRLALVAALLAASLLAAVFAPGPDLGFSLRSLVRSFGRSILPPSGL